MILYLVAAAVAAAANAIAHRVLDMKEDETSVSDSESEGDAYRDDIDVG